MSKTEILEEFAKLTPEERIELWDALWTLEERDLLSADTPATEEKEMLDREMDDYQKNPHAGSSWAEVETKLRKKS
jgi:putative addiction module component (TIGR02574 family)